MTTLLREQPHQSDHQTEHRSDGRLSLRRCASPAPPRTGPSVRSENTEHGDGVYSAFGKIRFVPRDLRDSILKFVSA